MSVVNEVVGKGSRAIYDEYADAFVAHVKSGNEKYIQKTIISLGKLDKSFAEKGEE